MVGNWKFVVGVAVEVVEVMGVAETKGVGLATCVDVKLGFPRRLLTMPDGLAEVTTAAGVGGTVAGTVVLTCVSCVLRCVVPEAVPVPSTDALEIPKPAAGAAAAGVSPRVARTNLGELLPLLVMLLAILAAMGKVVTLAEAV